MKSFKVAAVLASLALDKGSLAYGVAASLGAPFFLYRKWRLRRYLRLDCEFDLARWNLHFPRALEPQSKREIRPQAEPAEPRVAFVTLGWGEAATMQPLAQALREARPNAQLIFTVQHREAIPLASQVADEEVLPLPFDGPLPVARWLARAQPDLVIFYERFNHPTLLRSLWLQRVPFVIVHARMSAKRANNRSALNLKFKSWQLRGLRDILLPTPDYRPGTAQIAPATAKLHTVGSIKFPSQKPQIAPKRETDLRAWINAATQGAPLFIAGSTHEKEEEFILDAWEKMRAKFRENAPVLLLAPRKPYRTDEVLQLLNERKLRVSRRSQWTTNSPIEPADVLLLDTLGELMVAYQWSTGTFVGGTLSAQAHNVAEPLVWSKPVAYGPQRGNFGVEQQLCEDAGVGFRIHSPEELATHWTNLLQSPELREELALKAKNLVEAQHHAFDRTLQILIDAVDDVSNLGVTQRP